MFLSEIIFQAILWVCDQIRLCDIKAWFHYGKILMCRKIISSTLGLLLGCNFNDGFTILSILYLCFRPTAKEIQSLISINT